MTLLQGAPWLLAHRSMIQVNQPLKISLYGNDYVLWQDGRGEIHCLPNACPHMGAMLSAGWCVTQPDGSSAIACPFHALEFNSTGCTVLPGSQKQTQPLLKPLELIVEGDFIWSYAGFQPEIPIPALLNQVAQEYELIGCTPSFSVETDLLTMLINMHDYNHQNGVHRPLFEITEVQLKQFIDHGFHSHTYLEMPRAKPKLQDILQNPSLLVLPQVVPLHLENWFPFLVMVHGESPIISVRECHFFLPESATHTRTYVVLFAKVLHPIAHAIKRNLLHLAEVFLKQDLDILSKLYAHSPRRLKLDNEIGIEWVQRNFASFPAVAAPSLSR